jgi:predicted membrane-bound spermidine synthase
MAKNKEQNDGAAAPVAHVPAVRPPLLEIAVFVCGALVMSYEIIGSRILAPYIGTSTYVWTSLIGVILAALSLGYWLGGRLADHKPDVNMLASVIFLAGGAVGVMILLKDIALTVIARRHVPLELKSVIAALLLFAPASVMLGIVTPYAVKLQMDSLNASGRTVGRLYAISTVGSIAGTFLAGFVLIPFLGSSRTLYLIGGLLIAVSLVLVPFAMKAINVAAILTLLLGISVNEILAERLRYTNNLHDIDTQYGRIRVYDFVKERSRTRALAFDPFSVQSIMYLDREDQAAEYITYYHLVRHAMPDFQHSLIIGGAGYSFPKDYVKKYPGKEIDVVEIDPRMTQIARDHFRLQDSPSMHIFHEDGRIFLNNAPDKKYDAVFLDAFSSLFSIPFQLTTVEAVRQIDRVLKDDGVVIFNLVSAVKGDSGRFLHAELNTYRQVFPHIAVFKVQGWPDDQVQNLIIIASKKASGFPSTSTDPEFEKPLKHMLPDSRLPTGDTYGVLTDDLAPVEYYNSSFHKKMLPDILW